MPVPVIFEMSTPCSLAILRTSGDVRMRAPSAGPAGVCGGDLGVHLVPRNLEQRLVALDRVAHLLDPADDGPFGDRLAHLRHNDVSHKRSLNLVIWSFDHLVIDLVI